MVERAGEIDDLTFSSESFLRLERYFNDGSPSGFSEIHTTSVGHRPADPNPFFLLPFYDVDELNVQRTGTTRIRNALYPDMVAEFERLTGLRAAHSEKAIPTSSPRTLFVDQVGEPLFTKLSYQGLIGRVTRRMSRKHVISAVEVSHCFRVAIDNGKLPAHIQVLDEYSGAYFDEHCPLKDWGFVERSALIGTFQTAKIVPAFSLFATNKGSTVPLLHKLLDRNAALYQPDTFFDVFLRPLLDLYFNSVRYIGLQPEAHSQNVLYLIGDEYLPFAVVLRDMESVDKDLGIIEHFGLSPKLTELSYKTLRPTDYNYQIMHSFMFDFKLGAYLLGPLVDCWVAKVGVTCGSIVEELIRSYSRERISDLPEDYFPKDVWFDYAPVVHEGSATREYRANSNLRFR